MPLITPQGQRLKHQESRNEMAKENVVRFARARRDLRAGTWLLVGVQKVWRCIRTENLAMNAADTQGKQ